MVCLQGAAGAHGPAAVASIIVPPTLAPSARHSTSAPAASLTAPPERSTLAKAPAAASRPPAASSSAALKLALQLRAEHLVKVTLRYKRVGLCAVIRSGPGAYARTAEGQAPRPAVLSQASFSSYVPPAPRGGPQPPRGCLPIIASLREAEAHGYAPVDAVHGGRVELSHALAEAGFVQRAYLLEQHHAVAAQAVIAGRELDVRRQTRLAGLRRDGRGNNRRAVTGCRCRSGL